MRVAYRYLVPRRLIEISERTGVPLEALMTLIALRYGPVEYREKIRQEIGLPAEEDALPRRQLGKS